MNLSEDRQKMLLAVMAGLVVLFATIWVASRKVSQHKEMEPMPLDLSPEMDFLVQMEEQVPGVSVALEAVPGRPWNMPPFQTLIQDEDLAHSLQEELSKAVPLAQDKYVATSTLWILTIREDGKDRMRAQLLPRLQPIPFREREAESFHRMGLAIQKEETVYLAEQNLETLLKDLVRAWFREAHAPRSPLSPLEKEKARLARKEYDLLWPSEE